MNKVGYEACLKILSPLLKWNIVPTTYDSKVSHLLQLSDIDCLIDFDDGDIMSASLRKALSGLPFMKPALFSLYHPLALDTDMYTFFSKLLGTISKPQSVVKALGRLVQSCPDLNKKVSGNTATLLMEYLVANYDDIRCASNSREILQKLPIFLTKTGQLISVHQYLKGCYMVPHDIPNTDMTMFRAGMSVVFLKTPLDETKKKLYTDVGVLDMPDVEFYTTFCLEETHFQMLSDEGRLDHLTYLRDKVLTEKNRLSLDYNALLECLQNIAFIKDEDEQFCKANSFYDSRVDVFRRFDEKFLPKPYGDHTWKDFMHICGQIHFINEDMFVAYAKRIETESSKTTTIKDSTASAIALIQHMFEQFTLGLYPTRLLHQIRDIVFVPSHKVSNIYSCISAQHNQRIDGSLPMIKFKGACLPSSEVYVWTCAPLLPTETLPERYYRTRDYKRMDTDTEAIYRELGVFSTEIPGKYHVSNIMNVCNAIAGKRVIPSEAMKKEEKICLDMMYKKIAADYDEYPDELKSKLKKAEIVAVENFTRFVRGNVVFCDGFVEIAPYLYKMPHDLGPYRGLLVKLGCTDQPTLQQYAAVLNEIYNKAGNGVCDPNETSAIIKSVSGICRCRTKKGSFDGIEHLPLPHSFMSTSITKKDGPVAIHLYKSTDMIYNDMGSGSMDWRLTKLTRPLLARFSSEFDCNEEWLINFLPDRLKPVMLSSEVTEELVEPEEEVPSYLGVELKGRFQSELFARALTILSIDSAKNRQRDDRTLVVSESDIRDQVEQTCRDLLKIEITGHK